MNGADLLRRMRQHEHWAFIRLLEAARPLTMEQMKQPMQIGAGSLWDTLVHIYAADLIWIEAINGDPDPMSLFDVKIATFEELETAWQACDDRWTAFLEDLTELDMARMIEKKSTCAGSEGKAIRTPLADVIMHVCLHAQYTTAQATNMLRHLGVSPTPDTMLITMSRIEQTSLEEPINEPGEPPTAPSNA